jgi:hypothetical protein
MTFEKIKIPEDFTPAEREAAEAALEKPKEKESLVEKAKRGISPRIKAAIIIGNIISGSFLAYSAGTALSERSLAGEALSAKGLTDYERARLQKIPKAYLAFTNVDRGKYAESVGVRPQIKNSERIGVPVEILEEILQRTFPSPYATHNVETIEYSDKALTVPASYNLKDPIAIAACERSSSGKSQRIVFSQIASTQSLDEILNTLGHELAHAHDFNYARLPAEKRLKLLAKIIERLESENRYKSSYVEQINNPDKKKEMQNKANEYFAEIVGAYLYNPTAAKSGGMPKEDIAIVEAYIKELDPNFDAEKAAEERQQILLRLARPEVQKKILTSLKRFMEEHLAAELEEYMTEPISGWWNFPNEQWEQFKQEFQGRVDSMPKSWRPLYAVWLEGRRLKDLTRSAFNSRAPHFALTQIDKIKSNSEGFNNLLVEMDAAEREQAMDFFESLETLVNVDYSGLAPSYTFPIPGSSK